VFCLASCTMWISSNSHTSISIAGEGKTSQSCTRKQAKPSPASPP
jgi:hypothetical protein